MNDTPWSILQGAITRLGDKVAAAPSVREATVAATEPMAVLFDTDSTPTLVQGVLAGGITTGSRVLTLKLSHYVWILGAKGGVPQADPSWGDILDKPATYPPSPHNHDDRYYTKSQGDARYDQTTDTLAASRLTGTVAEARLPFTIAEGIASFPGGSSGSSNGMYWSPQYSVPFGKTFSSTPVVVASINSNNGNLGFAIVRTVSTTGFEYRVANIGSAPSACDVHWIARLS